MAHPRLLRHLNHDAPLPEGYALVNLNLRSVVDAEVAVTGCLFDQILDRYVSNEFWADCEQCEAKMRCPVKFNVDSFRYFPLDGLATRIGKPRIPVTAQPRPHGSG